MELAFDTRGGLGLMDAQVDAILNKSLSTSPTPPDLITIHLGTNDCNAGVNNSEMTTRMNTLLGHIQAKAPKAQVHTSPSKGCSTRPHRELAIRTHTPHTPHSTHMRIPQHDLTFARKRGQEQRNRGCWFTPLLIISVQQLMLRIRPVCCLVHCTGILG